MSKDGVMTSRDLDRAGAVTGAARVQLEREKLKAAEKIKADVLASVKAELAAEEEKKKFEALVKKEVKKQMKGGKSNAN